MQDIDKVAAALLQVGEKMYHCPHRPKIAEIREWCETAIREKGLAIRWQGLIECLALSGFSDPFDWAEEIAKK